MLIASIIFYYLGIRGIVIHVSSLFSHMQATGFHMTQLMWTLFCAPEAF